MRYLINKATGLATGKSVFDFARWKSFLDSVQTYFGAHPDPFPMGTGGCFAGINRPGSEVDQLPPYSTEVKNAWSYTSTLHFVFTTSYLSTAFMDWNSAHGDYLF
jgi:hypothetical protein